MRGYAIGAVLLLAGCGEKAAPPPPVEDAPVVMKAGEWAFTRTTTGYNTPTVTAEEYAAKVGKKAEAKACVQVNKDGKPDADALAGDEGSECTYAKDAILRNGRMIANLSCKAGKGASELLVEGNYTADSMTFGVSMTKTVDGKPVLRTTHDLSSKRVGDCPAG